jgi:hypothetical protein
MLGEFLRRCHEARGHVEGLEGLEVGIVKWGTSPAAMVNYEDPVYRTGTIPSQGPHT